MKIFLLAVLLLLACAVMADETEPEDLGVVSPRRAIQLDKGTAREDFLYFDIEFKPYTPPTNIVKFSTTNSLILLSNLVRLPSGKILMGVKSVFADGTTSPIELYTFRVWRGRPPGVRASPMAIGGDTNLIGRGENLSSVLQSLIRARPEPPPVPLPFVPCLICQRIERQISEIKTKLGKTPNDESLLDSLEVQEDTLRTHKQFDHKESYDYQGRVPPPPLPRGTNVSYAQGLDRIADASLRRNQ